MSARGDEAVTADRVLLDNRRTPCAVGLIRAAHVIRELPVATVLEIWSRDHFAPMEIPIWAERDGHEVRDLGMQGHWGARYYVFEVRKVTDRGGPFGSSRPSGS